MSEAELDWFGNPIGPDGRPPVPPVRCPFCTEQLAVADALERHLAEEHGHRTRRPVGSRPVGGPRRWDRTHAWVRGLRFLPLWYVLPVNLALAVLLWRLWGQDAQLFSVDGDESGVVKAWVMRLSLLPCVLLLAYRVGTRTDR